MISGSMVDLLMGRFPVNLDPLNGMFRGDVKSKKPKKTVYGMGQFTDDLIGFSDPDRFEPSKVTKTACAADKF